MKIEKGKVIKKIFLNCIYVIIALSAFYNVVFSISTTISQNDYLKLFGISLFNMETDLMKDDINSGDLIIARETNQEELQEGDIIAYTINGKTRINKIVRKQQDNYTTKSNQNYNPDIEKVKYEQIIGKVVLNMPSWGLMIEILQSKITTGVILLFLVLIFGRNQYLFTKKQERIRKKNQH